MSRALVAVTKQNRSRSAHKGTTDICLPLSLSFSLSVTVSLSFSLSLIISCSGSPPEGRRDCQRWVSFSPSCLHLCHCPLLPLPAVPPSSRLSLSGTVKCRVTKIQSQVYGFDHDDIKRRKLALRGLSLTWYACLFLCCLCPPVCCNTLLMCRAAWL